MTPSRAKTVYRAGFLYGSHGILPDVRKRSDAEALMFLEGEATARQCSAIVASATEITPAGPGGNRAPCDACAMAPACKQLRLACEVFWKFVHEGAETPPGHRIPSRRVYVALSEQ